MEENDQLFLLTLKLGISNFWENNLVKNFPETSFFIHSGHFSKDDCFSGLLRIENGNLLDIRRFLKKNHPQIVLKPFHEESNIFYCLESDSKLGRIIVSANSILSWPIKLYSDHKKIKIILKQRDISKTMELIEKKRIKILNFSKISIDFNFKDILTSKQKEILEPSLRWGYYEFPKKINLNALAEKLNISPSTLCVHLQKIESKMLNSDYSDLFFRNLNT